MSNRWLRACFLMLLLSYAQSSFAQSPQKELSLDREIKVRARINYLLFLPEGYEKNNDKWPLMLFLHGSGESGSDISKVKMHGPPKIVESKKDYPFIVVSPQAPDSRRGWDPKTLGGLIDEITEKYRVDKDRIVVTGLSMGGFGTWALAAEFPNRFAAIVPICGGGNPADASKIKNLPIWVFHGAKDNAVPIARSEAMVTALKAEGSKVKFTVYPDLEHDSWTRSYDDPELLRWLLVQKRGQISREP